MSMIERMRKASSSALSALQAATQEQPRRYPDDNFYYPTRDESGAAQVVIRFLPQADVEKIPYDSRLTHYFKSDSGGWCIVKTCPATYKQECPICNRNNILWNSNNSNNQAIARERKRKKEYIANILVLKDPHNPEKEGKVFLFRFGPTIYEKLKEAINPRYDDEVPMNPFDLWEGADFFFRIHKDPVKKQTSYEHSKFGKPSALYDGDEAKLEQVLKQCYDISSEIAKELKPYEEIEEMAVRAYANTNVGGTQSNLNHTETPRPAPVKPEPEFPATDSSIDDFRKMLDEIPF